MIPIGSNGICDCSDGEGRQKLESGVKTVIEKDEWQLLPNATSWFDPIISCSLPSRAVGAQ